jgi:predicted Fe-S protein YdhL (DUF1289 family)
METLTTESTTPVKSPCVRKCTLDDDDVCVGCFRKLEEICAWGGASNEQRQQILNQVAIRRSETAKRA